MPIYWTQAPYLRPDSRLFEAARCNMPRTRGEANVTARLEELAQRYGERFRPDPGWHL